MVAEAVRSGSTPLSYLLGEQLFDGAQMSYFLGTREIQTFCFFVKQPTKQLANVVTR